MEYLLIEGHRKGSKLLYTPTDGHLYVKKNIRNEKTFYICYQTILCEGKKKKEEYNVITDKTKCTARVLTDKKNKCWRNDIKHTEHNDHRAIFDDLQSLNSMKSECKRLKETYTTSSASRKITALDIYNEFMSK